jgi:hypothetical protein
VGRDDSDRGYERINMNQPLETACFKRADVKKGIKKADGYEVVPVLNYFSTTP